MGALLVVSSGLRLPLRPRSRAGRAPDSWIQLSHPSVSRDHGILVWTGGGWMVRDLGSAHGTFVGARRLGAGDTLELTVGDVVSFGPEAARLEDGGPPEPLARAAGGEWIEGRHGVLDLHAAEQSATIWRRGQGGWQAEGALERSVEDGERVTLEGVEWTLYLPDFVGGTPTDASPGPDASGAAIRLERGTYNPLLRVVDGPDGPISLSPTEARLLEFLASRGTPVSHQELLARVWGYREGIQSRTLYVTANRLRQKIEIDPASPRHVVAVPGVGYRFRPLEMGTLIDAHPAHGVPSDVRRSPV